MLKIWKGRRMSKTFIVTMLVSSVGGRFRTQQQPCRWKRITFCGRYLCFSFTFQRASAWATSWEKMWMLIASFPDEMWMLQQLERRNCRLLQKEKKQFLSPPIKRQAREVQTPCFLLTWYVPRPRLTEARFRRRTSHEPNRMQMSKILCSPSFAFDSAHVKYGVWTWPDIRKFRSNDTVQSISFP